MAGSPADSRPEQTCALHGYISNKNLDSFILYIYIDACVFQKKNAAWFMCYLCLSCINMEQYVR